MKSYRRTVIPTHLSPDLNPENIRTFYLPEGYSGPQQIVAVRQSGPADCAAACVYSILLSIGKGNGIEYNALVKSLGTTQREGVGDTSRIEAELKKHGIVCTAHTQAGVQDLIKALNQGHCCMIEYQAPDSDYNPLTLKTGTRRRAGESRNHGHYSLVIGVDQSAERTMFLLMDPLVDAADTVYGVGIRALDLRLLQRRWVNSRTTGEWMLEVVMASKVV